MLSAVDFRETGVCRLADFGPFPAIFELEPLVLAVTVSPLANVQGLKSANVHMTQKLRNSAM